MQVITEPTVTVVAATQFIGHPKYLIPSTPATDAEKLGAFAGKGCYDSYGIEGRSVRENQRAIITSAHGSVLEHATVSLFIEGITRGCSLELNRHRQFSISQRSTRYTQEDDAAIVLDPYYAELFIRDKWKVDGDKWYTQRMWEEMAYNSWYGRRLFEFINWFNGRNHAQPRTPDEVIMNSFLNDAALAFHSYRVQVENLMKSNPLKLEGFDLRKWARGKARNILPHGLETRGTWTANHRTWRWFIELRSERHAEPEIRRLAHHVLMALMPIAPVYYEDFKINEVIDGIPEYKPTYSKI